MILWDQIILHFRQFVLKQSVDTEIKLHVDRCADNTIFMYGLPIPSIGNRCVAVSLGLLVGSEPLGTVYRRRWSISHRASVLPRRLATCNGMPSPSSAHQSSQQGKSNSQTVAEILNETVDRDCQSTSIRCIGNYKYDWAKETEADCF